MAYVLSIMVCLLVRLVSLVAMFCDCGFSLASSIWSEFSLFTYILFDSKSKENHIKYLRRVPTPLRGSYRYKYFGGTSNLRAIISLATSRVSHSSYYPLFEYLLLCMCFLLYYCIFYISFSIRCLGKTLLHYAAFSEYLH